MQQQGSTKLPANKSVLVLGDNAAGKTTLIAKLQGVEDPKKGSGLEYAYIDVRDEYRDGEYWPLGHPMMGSCSCIPQPLCGFHSPQI